MKECVDICIQNQGMVSNITLFETDQGQHVLVGSVGQDRANPFVRKIDNSNAADILDRLGALCDVSSKAVVLGEPV